MLRTGLWIFTGRVASQVINVVLVVVLARLLTPEAFGIVATAQILFSTSDVITKFGFGTALIQADKVTLPIARSVQSIMTIMAIVISLIILLTSRIASEMLNSPELVAIMPLMTATFIISSLSNVSVSLISRDMNFRFLSLVELTTYAFGYGVVAITLALMGFSYWSLIIGMFVKTLAGGCLVLWKCPVWPTTHLRLHETRPILKVGSGVFFGQILAITGQRADNIVIASTLGPTALGHYSRAFSLMEMANGLLGSVFAETLLSGVAKLRRAGAAAESHAGSFLDAQAGAAFMILPIAVAIFLLSDPLIAVLLGDHWHETASVLRILAFGMFFRLAYKISSTCLLADGVVFKLSFSYIIYMALVFLGSFAGSYWGLIGISIGVTFALGANFLILTYMACVRFGVHWGAFIAAVSPFFLASAIAGAAGFVALDLARAKGVRGDILLLLIGTMMICLIYALGMALLRRNHHVASILTALFVAGQAVQRKLSNNRLNRLSSIDDTLR